MPKAIKAALLSGLVFPGLGQLILKHYLRGIAFMSVSLVSMILVMIRLTRQATLALEHMASGSGTVDIGALSDAAHLAGPSSRQPIALLLVLMLACWLAAVVDAYRLGRQQDRMTQAVFKIPDDGDG